MQNQWRSTYTGWPRANTTMHCPQPRDTITTKHKQQVKQQNAQAHSDGFVIDFRLVLFVVKQVTLLTLWNRKKKANQFLAACYLPSLVKQTQVLVALLLRFFFAEWEDKTQLNSTFKQKQHLQSFKNNLKKKKKKKKKKLNKRRQKFARSFDKTRLANRKL